MNRESFFPELFEPLLAGLSSSEIDHIRSRWFYFRSSLEARLGEILENLAQERCLAKKIAKRARKIYGWGSIAPNYQQMFLDAEAMIPAMSAETPSMRRILEFLRREGSVSKADILRQLKWAPKQRALSWTAFRKRLKGFAFEDACNQESVFQLRSEASFSEACSG